MRWPKILTWSERAERQHGDHCVTNQMIQARMQEEIDDLRKEVTRLRRNSNKRPSSAMLSEVTPSTGITRPTEIAGEQ